MNDLENFVTQSEPEPRLPNEELLAYLERVAKKYFDAMDMFASSPDTLIVKIIAARPKIETLFNCIFAAIKKYLAGYPHDAQLLFDEGLRAIGPLLDGMIRSPVSPTGVGWLYRMRIFDDLSSKSRSELFHIPFNLRHVVKAQRFSIPGIPCLYAGSTSYVCWEELNRPVLDKAFVMGMKIVKKLDVLSLAYTHKHIINAIGAGGGKLFPGYESEAESYFVCFPLIFSVHVPVAHPGSNFIEEYIIPQLLLRWVREHPNCIGVRYFSTHIDKNTDSHLASNFVFPTKAIKYSGHCDILAEYFECTEPVSWSLFQSLGLPVTASAGGDIFLTKERKVNYLTTRFGNFDGSIIFAPLASI